jgi:2-desacetyl-2-hydroxyethyl bacteriochlorophyllide A dehydrogenase
MKAFAAVVTAPEEMVMREIEISETGADDVLVKVNMVSICGGDPHIYNGNTHPQHAFPVVLGHEMVGWVEEVGENAANLYRIKKGDYVTVEPYIQCGKCKYCQTGQYSICTSVKGYGFPSVKSPGLPGAYATYMHVIPGSKIHKIAEGVPPEAACLSSVIGNGVRWARTKGKVGMLNTVVIIGAGAQGLSSLIAAKVAGACPIIITGLTRDLKKLELAKEFGADYVINAEEEDVVARVREITNGEMADVVIEVSGSAAGIRTAQNVLRPMGVHMQAGVVHKEISFTFDTLSLNELTIVGGLGQSWDVEDAVKIINSKKFALEKIITHKFALKDAKQAMEYYRAGHPECIKVALVCNETF